MKKLEQSRNPPCEHLGILVGFQLIHDTPERLLDNNPSSSDGSSLLIVEGSILAIDALHRTIIPNRYRKRKGTRAYRSKV